VEVQELGPGLWRWTTAQPGAGESQSLYWEGPGAVCLFDPSVPAEPDEAARFWRHLDADVERTGGPVAVFLTTRPRGTGVLELVRRYGASLHGPLRGLEQLPAGVAVVSAAPGCTAYRVPSSPPLVVGPVDA